MQYRAESMSDLKSTIYIFIWKHTHDTVFNKISTISFLSNLNEGHRGGDRMVVGFVKTYAISAYPH